MTKRDIPREMCEDLLNLYYKRKGEAMNKIFEKIMVIEGQINNLLQDLDLGFEHCEKNKKEITDELVIASDAVARIYKLNKKNFRDK
jgi:hypothetical protein